MTSSKQLAATLGLLTGAEVIFLKDLIQSLPGENVRILNIGAGVGTSALAMLECRPDSKVLTVDIQKDAHPLGSLTAELMSVESARLSNRLEQVLGDSVEVGKSYSGPDFNAIFIDGDHTYSHTSADILTWLPHVKSGGLIMIHDYGEGNGMWDIVKKAVDEHMAGYKKLGLVNCLIAFENTLE